MFLIDQLNSPPVANMRLVAYPPYEMFRRVYNDYLLIIYSGAYIMSNNNKHFIETRELQLWSTHTRHPTKLVICTCS